MFSHLLSHFPLAFLPCRPYTDTWSIVKFVMELNVDAQVHATTDALALIWDIDPHSTQEIAHALAIYLASKPAALQQQMNALFGEPSHSAADALADLHEKLNDPLIGATIVAQVGLSWEQYRHLISIVGRDRSNPRQPIRLVSGLSAGRLLPSLGAVQAFWHSETASVPGLRSFKHGGRAATVWPVESILNYIFASPFLLSFFEYHGRLDVIRRMDEFPQGGRSVFAESYTLRNFGRLCKVLPFQFLSIISHCTTHSGGLETLLRVNNDFLSCALQQGYVTIRPPGQPSFRLPLALRVCADDPMLRFFLRLQQSSSIYCCVYCLWLRGGPPTQDSTCLRVASIRSACVAIPSCGGYLDASNTAPMVVSLRPYDVVFCVLHALCRVGELVADLIYDYVASQVNPAPLFTQVQNVLLGPVSLHFSHASVVKQLNSILELGRVHLTMDVASKPAQGWHLKGSHAALLLKVSTPLLIFLISSSHTAVCAPDLCTPWPRSGAGGSHHGMHRRSSSCVPRALPV
jgi:hypothetical protein